MHNSYYSFGLVFGLVIGLVAAVLLIKYMRTDKKIKGHYDERQKILIGQGYRCGFYAVLIYNGIYFITAEMTARSIFDTPTSAFMNIFIGVLTFSIYCIWKEAYFSINDSHKRYIIILIVCLLINAAGTIGIALNAPIIENGVLTYRSLNLLCALLVLLILLTLAVKAAVTRFSSGEEE